MHPQGHQILKEKDGDRTLDADEINRLVCHYSNLHQRHQAAEDWWGGAVAIDKFFEGLPECVQEISSSTSQQQHRWRAWVVNTQTSTQRGSHWFALAVAARIQLLFMPAAS